jgi:hypothetical protein
VYAGAGVAQLAATTVKEYVGTASKKVAGLGDELTERVNGFDARSFAGTVQEKALAGVGELTTEAMARRAALEARVGELTTDARVAYRGLTERGEVLLARLRGDAVAEVHVTMETGEETRHDEAGERKPETEA